MNVATSILSYILAVAVKSQQSIRCYTAAYCDISQTSEAIQSSDAVGVCCNYPSAGVRPRGFAYQLEGEVTCRACPKSELSIDTSDSIFMLNHMKCWPCYNILAVHF